MTDAHEPQQEQQDLFTRPEAEQQDPDQGADSTSAALPQPDEAVGAAVSWRAERTRNSMLWAAYGDALGFISELTDRKGLERRTQGAPLNHLMAWERRVGGRWGVNVLLPAGSWSDDTQLRLAVSRSISHRGFDVETFARIELPVWLSYALGGGRASKAAAKNLGKPSTLWYANTFGGWANAGGNGAAMRIQPHVWGSRDLDDDYMLDVITDSVCTHGHPRAIVGACFHAATLAHCLRTGAVPDAEACMDITTRVNAAVSLIEDHPTLGPTWSGLWEKEAGETFKDAWELTIGELRRAIGDAANGIRANDSIEAAYAGVVERLGLSVKDQQGSGVLTTVAATVLAANASKAHEGVVAAANAVGTDTDTIASMAGALMGACNDASDLPEVPLDSAYLTSEAERLAAVSKDEQAVVHRYPDILTWEAPQTQADALVSDNGQLAVAGLGPVTRRGCDPIYSPRRDFAWEWVDTEFGQSLLIKRRPEVKPGNLNHVLKPTPDTSSEPLHRNNPVSHTRNENGSRGKPRDRGVDLDAALQHARQDLDDDSALGYTLRRIARDGAPGDLLNFAREIRDDLRR
ncbi:MAG: ADP-ribosylglycohydrolase family protein [Acidimicrobiaceae bacterium]|nr:ADP-ribosylglycohydrolase family protein [Acidimicrobiaceae bacterium]